MLECIWYADASTFRSETWLQIPRNGEPEYIKCWSAVGVERRMYVWVLCKIFVASISVCRVGCVCSTMKHMILARFFSASRSSRCLLSNGGTCTEVLSTSTGTKALPVLESWTILRVWIWRSTRVLRGTCTRYWGEWVHVLVGPIDLWRVTSDEPFCR